MLFTIGHSTHPLDEFVGLLTQHEIGQLADIRTVPRSRRNPEYNLDVLPGLLDGHGVGHRHLAELGGLRKVAKDSINTAWRNKSFQGYADHMATPEFHRGIAELEAMLDRGHVAIMCAEAVWWRCHRSLVAEAMLARGHDVVHIMPNGRVDAATLRPFAVVEGVDVTYPGTDGT